MRNRTLFALPYVMVSLGSCQGGQTSDADMMRRQLAPPAVHRPVATACPVERPPTPPISLPGERVGCKADADCTNVPGGQNGRCIPDGGPFPANRWHCDYDRCFEDAGCGSGVCGCGHGWAPGIRNGHQCVGGNCRTDADCQSGQGFCSPSLMFQGCSAQIAGYFCHTARDECNNNSDCGTEGEDSKACVYVDSSWTCVLVRPCA